MRESEREREREREVSWGSEVVGKDGVEMEEVVEMEVGNREVKSMGRSIEVVSLRYPRPRLRACGIRDSADSVFETGHRVVVAIPAQPPHAGGDAGKNSKI
jgi:hypothetical protein